MAGPIECAHCGAYPLTQRSRIWTSDTGAQIRWWCPVCWDWRRGFERPADPTLFADALPIELGETR